MHYVYSSLLYLRNLVLFFILNIHKSYLPSLASRIYNTCSYLFFYYFAHHLHPQYCKSGIVCKSIPIVALRLY